MLEGAPKEITEKEVFKALRRKLGPYVNLDQRYNSDFKASATNTVTAYNLISEHIDNGEGIPSTWTDLGFNAQTNFTLLKENDGQLFKKDGNYESLTAFIQAMKKFHGLTDLVSSAEQRTIEAERVRRSEEKKKFQEDAKSGALWRNRMPRTIVTQEVTSLKPLRPSPFRPRG